ncbi:MAG TPA: GNAT family N-acetyltransferase [Candidatus Limnocylindrales bacterium]|nr:GNAT family N-acetyltransferase [Candidatus Limnocylindrales bacterium]
MSGVRPGPALSATQTGLELRPIRPEEFEEWVNAMRRTFGAPSITPEGVEVARPITEFDRSLAFFDQGRIVATAGIFSFEMAVPGGRNLPCAGVTRVTVMPTHRRRGLLTAMMRREMEDCQARQEPLAALYASEAVIYGRFGYGVATYDLELEIPRSRSAFRPLPQPGGRMRLVDKDRALPMIQDIWARAQPSQPGMLTHTETWWRHDLMDLEQWREGSSEQYLAVYEDAGGRPQGFAQYRVKLTWTDNQPDGTLTILLLIAATPEAYAAVWRYCLDVDLIAQVKASMRRVDEPVRFLLVDVRAPKAKLWESLWLRLVDVPAALSGRRYARSGSLVLDVRDAFCPWNQRRWKLETSDGTASCTQTREDADLGIDVADLAAIYLGGNRIGTLAQAQRIDERRPGAVALADAMFASERTPWCPTHF